MQIHGTAMSIFIEEGKLIGMIIGEGVFDGCTELETMILPLKELANMTLMIAIN